MVKYVTNNSTPRRVFDPAIGAGAFFYAAKSIEENIRFRGFEIDPKVVPDEIVKHVEFNDFMLTKIPHEGAIVCNPPYKRHHRLGRRYKDTLNRACSRIVGEKIDKRAGLHVYFLIKALSTLKEGGRLAFILPADVCEGKFADVLWRWISREYELEYAIMFDDIATPFEADVNPIILMIKNSPPTTFFRKVVCSAGDSNGLYSYINTARVSDGITVDRIRTIDAVKNGLTRNGKQADGVPLGAFAHVQRGIATGANDFFHLTVEDAKRLRVYKFTHTAVNRTRDVRGDVVTLRDIDYLIQQGRPTQLLYLSGNEKSVSLDDYIQQGVKAGVNDRPLIKLRKKWHIVERREPPDFLFTYLGRRNNRFILNKAGVIPLNTFHCVYVKSGISIKKIFAALNDKRTIRNIPYVAKSYGSGALKIEPRSLERLHLPHNVLKDVGLTMSLNEYS